MEQTANLMFPGATSCGEYDNQSILYASKYEGQIDDNKKNNPRQDEDDIDERLRWMKGAHEKEAEVAKVASEIEELERQIDLIRGQNSKVHELVRKLSPAVRRGAGDRENPLSTSPTGAATVSEWGAHHSPQNNDDWDDTRAINAQLDFFNARRKRKRGSTGELTNELRMERACAAKKISRVVNESILCAAKHWKICLASTSCFGDDIHRLERSWRAFLRILLSISASRLKNEPMDADAILRQFQAELNF